MHHPQLENAQRGARFSKKLRRNPLNRRKRAHELSAAKLPEARPRGLCRVIGWFRARTRWANDLGRDRFGERALHALGLVSRHAMAVERRVCASARTGALRAAGPRTRWR